MIKNFTIVFFISIAFIGCKQKSEYVTIESERIIDSTYIPYADIEYNELGHGQIITENNREILICQNYKYGEFSNVFYFFDLKTKELLKTVESNNIPIIGGVERALYLNKDSIFLFFSNYDKVDTSLSMINENCENEKIFRINNPYFATSKHPFSSDSSLIAFEFFTTTPVYSNKKIFFSTTLYLSDNYGTKKFCNSKYPLMGYFDLDKDTVVLNHDIWFPNCKSGNYFPETTKSPYLCKAHNGNIIIGFKNSPLLYEWDVDKNSVIEHEFTSLLVDDILPEDNINSNYFSIKQPYYASLMYIDSLNMYVRYIVFPKETYGDFNTLAVFADSNFTYKGEAEGTLFGRYYINNNNNRNWDIQKVKDKWKYTDYKDSIKLVRKDYIFGKLDIEKIKSKMLREKQKTKLKERDEFCKIMGNNFVFEGYTEELMIEYTKKMFNIKDSTDFSLFVITDSDCNTCDKFVLNFMKANYSVINSTNTCLLFAGNNIDYFNNLIKEYDLDKLNNFAIDSSIFYKELHHFEGNNPRLLLVRENKVVSDTIYMPDDLEQIMLDYINFYNFETE